MDGWITMIRILYFLLPDRLSKFFHISLPFMKDLLAQLMRVKVGGKIMAVTKAETYLTDVIKIFFSQIAF